MPTRHPLQEAAHISDCLASSLHFKTSLGVILASLSLGLAEVPAAAATLQLEPSPIPPRLPHAPTEDSPITLHANLSRGVCCPGHLTYNK